MHGILAFFTGILFFHAFLFFPYVTGSLGLLSSAVLLMRRKPFLVLVFVLAAAYAFLRYQPDCEMPSFNETAVIRCTFETYPEKTMYGTFRQKARIVSAANPTAGGSAPHLIGKDVVIFAEREFGLGGEYELAVKFLKNRKRLNPGSYGTDTFYAHLSSVQDETMKKPSVPVMLQEWRHRIHMFITENFGKDSGAFIASMTIGQRADISERLKEAFNTAGLAHILSISGTHFGLFSVFLFGISRMVMRMLPYPLLQRLTLYLTPAQAAAAVSFPFMVAYLGISGGSMPAIRSFIMIVLFLFGLIIGRKGFWLNSLMFAAFLIVLWEPESLFNLSFQLSFLAVLFIGFTIRQADTVEVQEKRIFRYIRNAVLLTLAASLGTAPLVAYSFHYVSLISPVSNLVLGPLIGFVLIPVSVISAFVFLATGYYPFAAAIGILSDFSLEIIRRISDIPYADIKIPAFPPVIVLLFYGSFLIYFFRRERRYVLLIPFIPVVFYSAFSILDTDDLAVTFLDVGQGDAAVVELPDGKTLVVDTGMNGREVRSFLQYQGKKTIDALVLSHIHPDHTGGLRYIDERFRIREVWYSSKMLLPYALHGTEHRGLERGDVIEGEGYSISVLHPYPEFYTQQGSEYIAANNDSLVLRIADNQSSFLFAGDIEKEAEENMLHLGKWLASDVFKIPHHGGRTSAEKALFDAVNPDIGVISVEKGNRFGHPHQETLDLLSGKKVLRTDTDGAIRIKKSIQGYDIRTYADFRFERAYGIESEMRNLKRLFRTW
jgi:competence protein ComEC